jgi:hypothetical protein
VENTTTMGCNARKTNRHEGRTMVHENNLSTNDAMLMFIPVVTANFSIKLKTRPTFIYSVCIDYFILEGITADSAGWRLKQCSILSAAARCWLVSAITSLGG